MNIHMLSFVIGEVNIYFCHYCLSSRSTACYWNAPTESLAPKYLYIQKNVSNQFPWTRRVFSTRQRIRWYSFTLEEKYRFKKYYFLSMYHVRSLLRYKTCFQSGNCFSGNYEFLLYCRVQMLFTHSSCFG